MFSSCAEHPHKPKAKTKSDKLNLEITKQINKRNEEVATARAAQNGGNLGVLKPTPGVDTSAGRTRKVKRKK